MSPVKKPVKWAGKNRRRPPPPAVVYWRGTVIGAALVIAGIAVHVLLHEQFDLVPLALIIVGGAMIDPTAIRAASRMLSIRRNGGNTSESSVHGDM
jgi:hypothetical protein